MPAGGAPLSRHVEDFLRVCMCCRVIQGYGLTETCAASFIAMPDVVVSPLFSATFWGPEKDPSCGMGPGVLGAPERWEVLFGGGEGILGCLEDCTDHSWRRLRGLASGCLALLCPGRCVPMQRTRSQALHSRSILRRSEAWLFIPTFSTSLIRAPRPTGILNPTSPHPARPQAAAPALPAPVLPTYPPTARCLRCALPHPSPAAARAAGDRCTPAREQWAG
jgi:hypothetical protein